MANHGMSARLQCRYHPDAVIIDDFHAGDMICPECGVVVGDRVIDVRAEWRTFNYENGVEKDNSRVGAAETLPFDNNDLSTMISSGSGSNSAKDESGKALYKNRRSETSSQRSLKMAYQEIADMADRLHRPQILVHKAITLFKQAYSLKALRPHNRDAIVAASMYIACRQEGVPESFKEICAVSKESKKEIGRMYKLIIHNLKITLPLLSPADFLPRFCCNLSLSSVLQKAAIHIARKAVQMELLESWSPVSVASAAIYLASQASDERRTAQEIGHITGALPVTIRQIYGWFLPKATKLFPADFTFRTPIENLPSS